MFPTPKKQCFLLLKICVSYSQKSVFPTPNNPCFLLTIIHVSYSQKPVIPTPKNLCFLLPVICVSYSLNFCTADQKIAFPTPEKVGFLLVSYSFPTHLWKDPKCRKALFDMHICNPFSYFFNSATDLWSFSAYLWFKIHIYDPSGMK